MKRKASFESGCDDASEYESSSISDQESSAGDQETSQQDEALDSVYDTEASEDEDSEYGVESESHGEEEGSEYEVDEASESEDEPGLAAQRRDFHPTALGHDFESAGYADPNEVVEPTASDDIEDEIQQYHRDHSAMPVDGDEYIDLETLHNGNLRPAAHYRLGIAMTTEEDYQRKDYKEGTERLIVYTENQWRE